MSFTNYLHKLVFPLIILLLAYLPLAGQTPYVFRHLKVENGLSNNNVKTILKDCEGFLWIGTANGLNRYDGYLELTGRRFGQFVDWKRGKILYIRPRQRQLHYRYSLIPP